MINATPGSDNQEANADFHALLQGPGEHFSGLSECYGYNGDENS